MTRIAVEGLRKEFGPTVAIENLDLEIKDKEFVCFLGPSGCGKTTTLNCIAGLEKPTRGKIYFDDVLVNDIPPKDRGVGLVFQSYALFYHMTAFENLSFPLEIRKVPKAEREKEIERVSKFLDIQHVLNRRAATLALSDMQRVAIGRTLLSKPRVLMLDEPLSNLDAQVRATMRAELKRLAKELGQTTIYVTHDQVEAMTMADRIAVMSRGRLQQYDTPDVIYNHPRNRFVANFIGSPAMNFLDCSFEEREGRVFLVHEAFTLEVTELREAIAKAASTTELTIGIRPEHIQLSDKPTSKDAVKASVYVTELLGSETMIALQVGSSVVKAIVPMIIKAQIGEEKFIEFDREHMHIIDRKTEVAIV